MYDPAELAPFLSELSLEGPLEPFLVFADWLQARGDPWGELIALQCQPSTHDEHHKKTLALASFGILERVADTLCPRDQAVGISWRRGFVAVIAFGDAFGPAWLGDELARLFASPVTALCTELSFTGAHLDDDYVQPILRFKSRLERIPKLDLENNWFSPSVVAGLRAAFPNARVALQHGEDEGPSERVVLLKSWDDRGDA